MALPTSSELAQPALWAVSASSPSFRMTPSTKAYAICCALERPVRSTSTQGGGSHQSVIGLCSELLSDSGMRARCDISSPTREEAPQKTAQQGTRSLRILN